jgi:uncharacterized protein HemX
MKTNTAKIKYIPTELNYINYTNNRLKNHSIDLKITAKLILFMLLWLTALTGYTVYEHIQQQKELINQTIINQEGIPLENISIDEFEVIND